MAIIRDFLKEKEMRRKDDTRIDYKERIRSHKLALFYRTILAIVLVVVLAYIIYVQQRDKVYSEMEVVNSSSITIVQGATPVNLDGYLLLYSKDGASCTDVQGKAIWNRTYEMQSPLFAKNGSVCAVGDYNGREIYVMSNTQIKGMISTNLPIRAISVAESGLVAAVLDDADVLRINLYDGNSDTEDTIVHAKVSMDKSGYPMSISLSPNGKMMMVSYFYVDSGEMKSSLAFYNFGDVGSNEADNYVSGYDYANTVFPYVRFMDNDSAFGISDDRIVFFQGSEKPTSVASSFLNEEVAGVYYGEDYVGLTFFDTTGTARYRLDVYNANGEKVLSKFIDIEYKDISFYKNQIIIYDELECEICNINGRDKYLGSLDKGTSLIIPSGSSKKYALVGTDYMDVVDLR